MIYADWDGHSKAAMPQLNQLANELLSKYTLVIGQWNGDVYRNFPENGVNFRQFPTFYLKQRGQPPIEYAGPRNAYNMKEFLYNQGVLKKEEFEDRRPGSAVIQIGPNNWNYLMNQFSNQSIFLLSGLPYHGYFKREASTFYKVAKAMKSKYPSLKFLV